MLLQNLYADRTKSDAVFYFFVLIFRETHINRAKLFNRVNSLWRWGQQNQVSFVDYSDSKESVKNEGK